MNAAKLVSSLGSALLGRHVMADPVGGRFGYPGGLAVVIEINPDPNAPEIVCNVRHATWREDCACSGEVGIFEWENLQLIDQEAA